jgi:hypothetical protein
MDLKNTGCEIVDQIYLAQNRIKWWAVMDTAVKLRFY